MLAPIRLGNTGSCPSRQRDCVAEPIRLANAAAPLLLRSQAKRKAYRARSAETKGTAPLPLRGQPRRKETHPHHPSTPLPPLRDSSMTGRTSVWWLYEKRLHSQSRHHCLHLLVRRTRLEAAGRVEHPGQQMDIANCIQEQALPLQNPVYRPVDILLIF